MTIRLRADVHNAGEATTVEDWGLVQVLGWWVAAELIRRHPGQLYAYATGGEFQYDCLAVSRLAADGGAATSPAVVWMNRLPGGHLTTGSWFDDASSTDRFNWMDVLLVPDRLGYVVEQIEQEAKLGSPASSPATTKQSIAARVISGFLLRTTFNPKSWLAASGLWDSGMGEAGVNMEMFDAVPGMSQHAPRPNADGHFTRDAFRHWFLCPTTRESVGQAPRLPGTPAVGFDLLEGLCWNGGEEPIQLMNRYQEVGRSVDALISSVCPPAF